MTDNVPTLYGIEISWPGYRNQPCHGTLVFCDQCEQTHLHGGGSDGSHKVAHCTNEKSRYRDTGYYVKVINWTEKEFRDAFKFVIKARTKKRALLKKGKKR